MYLQHSLSLHPFLWYGYNLFVLLDGHRLNRDVICTPSIAVHVWLILIISWTINIWAIEIYFLAQVQCIFFLHSKLETCRDRTCNSKLKMKKAMRFEPVTNSAQNEYFISRTAFRISFFPLQIGWVRIHRKKSKREIAVLENISICESSMCTCWK